MEYWNHKEDRTQISADLQDHFLEEFEDVLY
jgi:hypothetical protein